MIEDLPLKMKAIKMLNPRKDDNKSVYTLYFTQNFKIESVFHQTQPQFSAEFQSSFKKFFPQNFVLAQKMRLEISE